MRRPHPVARVLLGLRTVVVAAGERREQLRELTLVDLGLIGAGAHGDQRGRDATRGGPAAAPRALNHRKPATARGI